MTNLSDALRQEYDSLFATCSLRTERVGAVDGVVDKAVAFRHRYDAVAQPLGCPWYVVAAIHSLEASSRFDRHLHNGDPLTARTVRVPAGRPPHGTPPFTWEASAQDALQLKRFQEWTDWSVAGLLFKLEQYNGWGYRRHHPEVLSPYLWSFTSHYSRGKYVADGKFDANAVSQQCGAAAFLRRISDRSIDKIGSGAPPPPPPPPPFPGMVLKRGMRGSDVCRIQSRLRQLGHAIAEVPGCPFGPQTEAAVRAFQEQRHLEVDGKVGRNTWAALFG
ncbi:MAG TPA: peptidoglycan-binding protein [Acidimicrobiales bacterium]|nr:peptidoglycan-binding protein [Acidimicrobiales bacterium]